MSHQSDFSRIKISYDTLNTETFRRYLTGTFMSGSFVFLSWADESSVSMWVTEDFPRITSSGLPSALQHQIWITYCIKHHAFLTTRALSCGGGGWHKSFESLFQIHFNISLQYFIKVHHRSFWSSGCQARESKTFHESFISPIF